MTDVWTLHETPHRHYKLNGKWNVGNVRIASVTQVLDTANSLTSWAASQALAASEQVARDWIDGAESAFTQSLLTFGELAVLQPEWPDNVRDAKGDSGTLAHSYLADCLAGLSGRTGNGARAPYGLRVAIDGWITKYRPTLVKDQRGMLVERVVGDKGRAVAGTYDAVVDIQPLARATPTNIAVFMGHWGRHRLDLKQSRTVQPKHFAQLAAYERLAILCGEESSDYLTVLHAQPTGIATPHSIPAYGGDARRALAIFDAHLTLHRETPRLAKAFA